MNQPAQELQLAGMHRRVDDLDAFAAEHLVEGGGELAVAIVDQETHPLDNVGEAEVARLLKDPGSGRIRRATGKVDAPAPELDEEEHIETTQRDRLDREEVAGEQARRVTAQKRRPAHRVTAWRGLEPGGGKQTPPPVREQSRKRRDERPISRAKPRSLLPTSQNRELVPQQHQLHVLGELGRRPRTSSRRTAAKAR
jgi:hypothetical protein